MRSVGRYRGMAVAETDFALVYDGPALTDGRMPVRDLAPAVLALSEVFAEANEIVNPGGRAVALEIQATDRGSFDVMLVLQHAGEVAVDLLTSEETTAIVNLQNLIVGSGVTSLFGFIAWRKGRRIVSEQPRVDGDVDLTLNDGTTVKIPGALARVQNSVTVRNNARSVVAPVNSPGVDRVEFRDEQTVTVSLGRDDVGAFELEPGEDPDRVVVSDQEFDLVVEVVSPVFSDEDRSWRVNDGEHSFRATMDDSTFIERVVNRAETFAAGDRLQVRMRRRQYQTQHQIRNEWTILRVIRHWPVIAVEQQELGPPAQLPVVTELPDDDPPRELGPA